MQKLANIRKGGNNIRAPPIRYNILFFLNLNIFLHMISDFGKEEFHTLRILVVDDVDELSKLLSDLCHLTRCVWVEEDFLQQVIIFVEHALSYLHVALEGGARSILVLHHCRKGKGAHERNTQRVGHRLVVLIKCILMQTQPQLLVEVLEEYLAHVVTLLDDDCILL